jgi:hypothetical protein
MASLVGSGTGTAGVPLFFSTSMASIIGIEFDVVLVVEVKGEWRMQSSGWRYRYGERERWRDGEMERWRDEGERRGRKGKQD